MYQHLKLHTDVDVLKHSPLVREMVMALLYADENGGIGLTTQLKSAFTDLWPLSDMLIGAVETPTIQSRPPKFIEFWPPPAAGVKQPAVGVNQIPKGLGQPHP